MLEEGLEEEVVEVEDTAEDMEEDTPEEEVMVEEEVVDTVEEVMAEVDMTEVAAEEVMVAAAQDPEIEATKETTVDTNREIKTILEMKNTKRGSIIYYQSIYPSSLSRRCLTHLYRL